MKTPHPPTKQTNFPRGWGQQYSQHREDSEADEDFLGQHFRDKTLCTDKTLRVKTLRTKLYTDKTIRLKILSTRLRTKLYTDKTIRLKILSTRLQG